MLQSVLWVVLCKLHCLRLTSQPWAKAHHRGHESSCATFLERVCTTLKAPWENLLLCHRWAALSPISGDDHPPTIYRTKARLVRASHLLITVDPILSFQPGILFNDIKLNHLLIKIPNDHVGNYATHLVQEFMQPLRSTIQHATHSHRIIVTLIICETILSLLPIMSIKDMLYKLLKGYNIMPPHSGMMAIHKHLMINMTSYVSQSEFSTMRYLGQPRFYSHFTPILLHSTAIL